MKHDFNTIVIGAGSAGLVSAYIAAASKAKVALVEKHKMGGDCLNTGCVPSKAIIKAAKLAHQARTASTLGIHTGQVDIDFAKVMQHVHDAIKAIEPHDSIERYTELGVDCLTGEARIVSAHEVRVNDKVYTTRNIIIATGASPFIPDIPGIEEIDILTSETLWSITELPQRLLVLGGGPIGVEMAQAMSRLGASVTIIDRNERLLKKEDPDVSSLIENVFINEGIQVMTNHELDRFSSSRVSKVAHLKHQDTRKEIEFDAVIVALGRKANITGFGLEQAGVKIREDQTIDANDYLQTNIPNIYVCGDVTGPYQFTHVAAHQAWYASVNALASPFKKFKVDYSVIPWATFTDPEVAHVGLNETQARAQGIDYEVTRYELEELDRAITDAGNHGFVKVLTPPGKDRILGATIVGEHASDMIPEFIFAMRHNMGLRKILGTIHIYPTLSEANKFAAGNWQKAHMPGFLLTLAEKFHQWRR